MSGRDARESAPGRHRFKRGRLYWEQLPGGGHYPFGLRTEKAEVLLLVGRWGELEDICRRDLEVAVKAQSKYYICNNMMKQAELLIRRQNNVEAGTLLEGIAEMAREAGEPGLVEKAQDLMVGVCLSRADYDRAEAILDQLIGTARVRGNQSAVGWFLNYRASILFNRGESEKALGIMRERLAIAKRYGGQRDIAQGCISLGGILGGLGRYRQSMRYSSLSAGISRRIGDCYLLYYALYNMATACAGLGRKSEALEYFHRDLALARQLGDGPGAEQVMEDIARIRGSMGDG